MKYIIGQANGRARAVDAVRLAEIGTVIEVGVVKKSREQEEKSIKHNGECLGDHPELLNVAKTTIKELDSWLADTKVQR